MPVIRDPLPKTRRYLNPNIPILNGQLIALHGPGNPPSASNAPPVMPGMIWSVSRSPCGGIAKRSVSCAYTTRAIGRALPTRPTNRPASVLLPDVVISSQDGYALFAPWTRRSQRPTTRGSPCAVAALGSDNNMRSDARSWSVLLAARYLKPNEKTVPCGTAVPVNPCGHDFCVMLTPARVEPESRNRSSTDNAPFAGSKLMM